MSTFLHFSHAEALSSEPTLSLGREHDARHNGGGDSIIELLRCRGWISWRALRPQGPGDGPISDTATVADRQTSEGQYGSEGKLEEQSPLCTTPFPVLFIVLAVLGGALNSGFLIAGGFTIFCAGPGGALMAFALTLVALYAVMMSLMELRSVIPEDVPYYMFGAHVLGQAVGAAMAWNFWLMWISIVAYEIVAVGHIVHFWIPHIHSAVWCPLLFLFCVAIVVINTKYYTLAEHGFTMLKLCGVVVALIIGALVASGKIGDHKYGVENWHRGDAPFVGGVLGIACAAVYSNFAVVGTEAAAVMAMRSCNPRGRYLVPAIVCGGMAVLFFTTVFVTGLIIPYDSNWFISDRAAGESAESSTFTYVFDQAKVYVGAHIINAVLLLTALFDCCASLYVSSSLLQDLAARSLAPRVLKQLPMQGRASEVPTFCLVACSVVALTIWALSLISVKYALSIISGAVGMSGFIMWGAISVMHCKVRWSKRFRDLAKSTEDAYRAWLFPVGPVYCLLYVIMAIGGLIWVSIWIGFEVNMFLLATTQLFIFIILLVGAVVAQYFGHCRC
ncbi:hypothetical protein GGI20_003365 [Coemansia sp. BCRC 34301]|nr:hypothetical protein GGI20_003365 [Coemansia sp. BCRC 34301]